MKSPAEPKPSKAGVIPKHSRQSDTFPKVLHLTPTLARSGSSNSNLARGSNSSGRKCSSGQAVRLPHRLYFSTSRHLVIPSARVVNALQWLFMAEPNSQPTALSRSTDSGGIYPQTFDILLCRQKSAQAVS